MDCWGSLKGHIIKHILYQTTNTINGHIYVGVHSTDNENDGYMGSGVAIKNAIDKLGKEHFETITLAYYKTRQELLEAEAFIVDSEFVSMGTTYNKALGGSCGGSKRIGNRPDVDTEMLAFAYIELFDKNVFKYENNIVSWLMRQLISNYMIHRSEESLDLIGLHAAQWFGLDLLSSMLDYDSMGCKIKVAV